jgi:cobalt-zinc-cadmium efflux system outer membrane protein
MCGIKATICTLSFLTIVYAASGEAQDLNRQTTLSLSQAIAEALEKNPELQAARKKVDSVRAKAAQAGYLEDPELNLQAWAVPLNHPVRFRSANPIIIGMRQKFPFFGKLGLKEEIAAQEVQMSLQDLRSKEVEVITHVKTTYAALFIAERSVEINRELLELTRQLTTQAENLYRLGKTPQQDIFRGLLEQTDYLNKLAGIEKDFVTARARLNLLLNRPQGTPLQASQELESTVLSFTPAQLERIALEQRPQLRAMEASIIRSEKTIDLARRNQKFPDLMVGLEYWVAPDQRPRHMYSPMLTLTIPFSPWTKGKHEYEVEQARAERDTMKASFEAMKNMVLFEVREAVAKTVAARRSVELYKDGLLPQAEQSFQSAIAAYQTGSVNFMTLLDAQKTIRDGRLGYYKSLVEYEQSRADLERAVGRELK